MRYSGPRIGDSRIKKGFLFIPRQCMNRQTGLVEWRWLEHAVWRQRYMRPFYVNLEWIDGMNHEV